MLNYTIMPLDTQHIEEICADIKRQYKQKIASCALFMIKLVPEGNPPINKAELWCKKYDLFKERLERENLKCGILVQVTIGHGYQLDEMFPFQQYINFSDEKPQPVCCPYDENVKKYFYEQFAIIAKHSPEVIMVDDDFRLMFREGKGCACPLHLSRINELSGEKLTVGELRSRIFDDKDTKLHKIFYDTQGEALLSAAKAMRAGIDSVNPKIPGCFCACGNSAEFGAEIAKALAGNGNPVTIRINNGHYSSAGARFFSPVMYRAARQIAVLKGKADYILAETDTCPQNRYSTGANSLHSHYTASILEGCNGAKQWITRLIAFEPSSGDAYRKILSKYSKFYNVLAEIQPELNFVGCRIPITDKPDMKLGWDTSEQNAWYDYVLERLGIPFYFSNKNDGVLFADADDDEIYTDDELIKQLSGWCVLSASVAQKLINRGMEKYIGVDIKPWTGEKISGEKLFINGNCCTAQFGAKELIPLNSKVEELSVIYHLKNGDEKEALFPGVTKYKNELGGTVVTFCGSPKAEYHYTVGFSFLNESRKKQLISILGNTGALPVYYPDDAEILLRAATVKSTGELFCAVFNIGLDNLTELPLVLNKKVKSIKKLMPNGKKKKVLFTVSNNKIILKTKVNVLEPVILFIKCKGGEN